MICCFTGHRIIPDEHIIKLPEMLDNEIHRLIVCGVTSFRCGGALGFDTLAALKVIEKKKQFGFISLDLILPCRDQTNGWSQRNKFYYDYILSEANTVEYISPTYNKLCMHQRNRRLVDGSDFCVAYCSSSNGGSAYTMNYAVKSGVEVINLFNKIQKD